MRRIKTNDEIRRQFASNLEARCEGPVKRKPMTGMQQQIQDIIDNAGGDYRKLSKKSLDKIALLTWECEATYADVVTVGGNMLLDKVWRQENILSKKLMQREFKKTGTLDLSWRKGVEMAAPNRHMTVQP